MNRRNFVLAAAGMAGMALPGRSASPAPTPALQTVEVAVGPLPPYFDPAREDGGLAMARLREALRSAGLDLRARFMPWRRALMDAQNGEVPLTFGWTPTPERSMHLRFSRCGYSVQNQLVGRLGLGRLPQGDGSPPRRLGLIRGYHYPLDLTANGSLGTVTVETLLDEVSGLRMLQRGRLDYLVLNRAFSDTALAQAPWRDVAEAVRGVDLHRSSWHFAIGRHRSEGLALLERIDTALQGASTVAPIESSCCRPA